MIKLKGKTEEQIIEELQALKKLKQAKIKRIAAEMQARPVPEDVLATLGIWDKNTPITPELEEDARNAHYARQEVRMHVHKNAIQKIEKELLKRGVSSK